ncbi:MAG: MFS transporter, partial [Pseudomonadota bacterium]|nr:MFS transporter [Pseudomonadota bacterium]
VAAGAVMAAAGDGAAPATGLHLLAWLALIGGAVTVPVLLVLVPEPPPPGGDHRAEGAGWRAILANKLFLRLLVAWFVNGIANGVPAALFLLYLRHGLEVTAAEEGMFILAYFAAGILAIPLWLGLARRLGKHRAWALAMALACAAFITVPFLEARETLWFLGVCMITGMALGADLALPPAIQGDVVDVDTWRHGQARAGTFFALWSMATKLALAVAVGVALPSLAALGFDAAAVDAEGRLVLVVIYTVPAVVMKGLAILLVWSFPLTGAKHAVVRRRLQRRAAANRYGMEAG